MALLVEHCSSSLRAGARGTAWSHSALSRVSAGMYANRCRRIDDRAARGRSTSVGSVNRFYTHARSPRVVFDDVSVARLRLLAEQRRTMSLAVIRAEPPDLNALDSHG